MRNPKFVAKCIDSLRIEFVYLLILVSCVSVLSQTVEPETLYGKALETLESLEPRQPIFPVDARTGQQQETHAPVVWRVAGYLFRHYVSGFLPDLLTFGGRRTRSSPQKRATASEELIGTSQGIDQKDIPSISPSDSKSLKRAKAVRLLELAGYQMAHQPSLMTLGNMFLVRCFLTNRKAYLKVNLLS